MASPELSLEDLLAAFKAEAEFDAALADLGYDLDADEDLDEIKAIKTKVPAHPTIKVTKHLELRKTPKRYVAASLMGNGKPDREEIRHWNLTLSKYEPSSQGGGYEFDTAIESFKLEDDEIARLAAFIVKHLEAAGPGEYLVIPKGEATKGGVGAVVAALAEGKLEEADLQKIVSALVVDDGLRRSVAGATPDSVRRQLSAALSTGVRRDAIDTLVRGIGMGEQEEYFQRLLVDNWWMFGGRYTQLVDRRDYTTDETYDIPLLTADGFVEIIELKRPSEPIMKRAGNRWTVTSAVSDAVNQVANYLAEAERVQDTILAKYEVDFFKARGKVIIGTLSPQEQDFKAKRRALRTFNSHLHGIEVITYTELSRRAEQLVALDARVAGLQREGAEQDGDDLEQVVQPDSS